MFDAEPRLADPGPLPHRNGRPGVSDYLLAMSAELRAPLNSVIGMSGLLLDGDLGDRQRQYVRSIHSAGERLSSTLNDLLDLARIQAGRLPIEPIGFDLQSMVEETAGVLSAAAADRGLALRVDWRPELPRHVVGDPGRTRQVLGNLVSHAVNSTSQGEVVIRVAPDGDHDGVPVIRFTVDDTGIGLPADRLERVFDEYLPVDASPYRSFGVTGLGLRISAELVRLMGGDIGAESDVGRGSRFWFRLPMAMAEAPSGLLPEQPEPSMGGRVLFVEADQASRRRFTEQLAQGGWHVDFADELSQVEERLREARGSRAPYRACVLSDYAVRPSHAELATRLKADPELAAVALVIVTAVGSPGEARRLWHAGFAAYLRKPLPAEELNDALRAVESVGEDGRPAALITRHSLAESRSARAPADFDGFPEIDAVLASLGAPAVREVTVIGVGGADQLEITEALARAGLTPAPAISLDQALSAGPARPELVLIDADREGQDLAADIGRLGAHHGGPPGPPVIALTVDPSRRADLLAAGAASVVARPIRRADLEQAIRQLTAPAPEPETMSEPDAQLDLAPPTVDTDDPAPEAAAEPPMAAADPAPVAAIVTEPVEDLEREDTVTAAEAIPLDLSPMNLEIESDADQASAEVEPPGELIRMDLGEAHDTTPVDGFLANDFADLVAAPEEDSMEPLELESAAGLEATGSAIDLPSIELPGRTDREPSPAPPEPLLLPPGSHSEPVNEPEEDTRPTAAFFAAAGEGVEIGTLTLVMPPAREPAEPPREVPARVTAVSEVEVRSALPVVSQTVMEQLASSASFARHLVGSFLRDAPQRIGEMAAAASRGDAERMGQALKALQAMAGLLGAGQLAETCAEMETMLAEESLEEAASRLGEVERAFLEVRAQVEQAASEQAAIQPPAVAASFLDQLAPGADAASRALALKLAGSFRTDAAARLPELAQAIGREDGEAVQRLAPVLKGMCGLIGADPLAKLCALAEADARLRRVGSARRYVDQMTLELDRVLEALGQAGG